MSLGDAVAADAAEREEVAGCRRRRTVSSGARRAEFVVADPPGLEVPRHGPGRAGNAALANATGGQAHRRVDEFHGVTAAAVDETTDVDARQPQVVDALHAGLADDDTLEPDQRQRGAARDIADQRRQCRVILEVHHQRTRRGLACQHASVRAPSARQRDVELERIDGEGTPEAFEQHAAIQAFDRQVMRVGRATRHGGGRVGRFELRVAHLAGRRVPGHRARAVMRFCFTRRQADLAEGELQGLATAAVIDPRDQHVLEPKVVHGARGLPRDLHPFEAQHGKHPPRDHFAEQLVDRLSGRQPDHQRPGHRFAHEPAACNAARDLDVEVESLDDERAPVPFGNAAAAQALDRQEEVRGGAGRRHLAAGFGHCQRRVAHLARADIPRHGLFRPDPTAGVDTPCGQAHRVVDERERSAVTDLGPLADGDAFEAQVVHRLCAVVIEPHALESYRGDDLATRHALEQQIRRHRSAEHDLQRTRDHLAGPGAAARHAEQRRHVEAEPRHLEGPFVARPGPAGIHAIDRQKETLRRRGLVPGGVLGRRVGEAHLSVEVRGRLEEELEAARLRLDELARRHRDLHGRVDVERSARGQRADREAGDRLAGLERRGTEQDAYDFGVLGSGEGRRNDERLAVHGRPRCVRSVAGASRPEPPGAARSARRHRTGRRAWQPPDSGPRRRRAQPRVCRGPARPALRARPVAGPCTGRGGGRLSPACAPPGSAWRGRSVRPRRTTVTPRGHSRWGPAACAHRGRSTRPRAAAAG